MKKFGYLSLVIGSFVEFTGSNNTEFLGISIKKFIDVFGKIKFGIVDYFLNIQGVSFEVSSQINNPLFGKN